MMRKLHPNSGVTLMELMIAVSLVSFLSLGMLLAIRVGLNAMEKTNTRFAENRKSASVQRILESQIAGIMPVESECRGGGGAGKFAFFEGKPQHMRMVSTYSLTEASRGYPRILEFQVIPGDRGEGVRLIVNEAIYPGPVGAGLLCSALANGLPVFGDVAVKPDSFVIADKLQYCRLVYRQTMPPPEVERWLPEWTVADRLPSAIRIEMAPLKPDPARVQNGTVTVPVRINKWLMAPYYDE